MAKKTSINNLNIVWQGQSWSVIAPNGIVLGRFKQKRYAISFAEGNQDFLDETYAERDLRNPSNRSSDGELPDDWMESSPYEYSNSSISDSEISKRKNEEKKNNQAIESRPINYGLIRITQHLLAFPAVWICFFAGIAIIVFGLWDVGINWNQNGFSVGAERFVRHCLELFIVYFIGIISAKWFEAEPEKLESSNYRKWLIWSILSFGIGLPVGGIAFIFAFLFAVIGIPAFICSLITQTNTWLILILFGPALCISSLIAYLGFYSLKHTEDLGRNN